MSLSKAIAAFAMLPYMWGLLQIFVNGNLWGILYVIPYVLFNDDSKKKTAQQSTHFNKYGFIAAERKDVGVWTGDTDCGKDLNGEALQFDVGTVQNNTWITNPFLHMIENAEGHTEEATANPFLDNDGCYLLTTGNPFLGLNDIAEVSYSGDRNPPLRSSNPFLQESSRNQIIDLSIFFPNGLDELLADALYIPEESDLYCKKWIDQHRKFFIKTTRSFSIH